MRKLKPSEVAVLVAGLTIGSGNVDADEQQQVIATVTVTASAININVSTAFVFSPGYVGYSSPPTAPGTIVDAAVQQQHRHAIECAAAYGRTRGAVPKAGWVTYFANNFGWLQDNTRVYSTDTNAPPPGTGFEGLQGVTTHYHPAYPYIQGQSKIFLKSHNSTGDLINTIAHEWAHQWQAYGAADEVAAGRVGDNVEAAWRADGGAQCGGL
jgi:hypothetical protein